MAKVDKHIEKLTATLQNGEEILATVSGTITNKPTDMSGTIRGALVLTDRRFLFSGTAWGAKGSKSFPLQQVTSIDLHKNLMLAYIQVTLAGGFERFMVKYADAEPFVATAHDALSRVHVPRVALSAADELAKFAALHERGQLSDEEFTATKAKLLGL